MTNDENTYIGMSLPEGIRYITVFEKGDFENCGRILRTFYRTEDRVRKLLALGNLLHLGGSLSSNENKTSCWPLNNGNPIHEAKEISGKEKFFLLGDWTYLYEMADGFWAMKEKSMKSAILNFLSLFPTRTIRLPLWTKDFPLP